MLLGYSLSPDLLRNDPNNEAEHKLLHHFGSPQAMLTYLQNQGIVSIELRNIMREEKEDCEPLYRMIWDHGLQITAHGRFEGSREGEHFADDYPSLRYALQNYHHYQERLVLTLHAYAVTNGSQTGEQLSEASYRQLQRWLKQTAEEDLNVQFIVELTRRLPKKTDPGGSVESLLSLVRRVNDDRCGICWDMGHYYSNCMRDRQYSKRPDNVVEDLPVEEFMKRTMHTHIHGLSDKCRTHFPLVPGESLPLELYVSALQAAGYNGVYNLELDCQRFVDHPQLFEEIEATIERLRNYPTP